MRNGRVKRLILTTIIGTSLLFMSGCIAEKDAGEPEKISPEEADERYAPMEKENPKDIGVGLDAKEWPEEVLEETAEMLEAEEESQEAGNTENIVAEINKDTADISGLDNTPSGWGPGVNFDDQNRPAGAVNAQEKYEKYDADFVKLGEEEKNRIYLTFDEGYENGYTPKILDVLKEKNVLAVFFVTLPYVKQQPELIRRMIDEGHIVGNHSVTHPSAGLPSQSVLQQEQELMELHQYMKDNFDYEMSLFRYPAGIYSEQSLALVNNLGYSSVFWSFAYKDWDPENQPDESEALAKLKERLHPGAIYLLHAVSETNANILGQFIDDARAVGYEFLPYK